MSPIEVVNVARTLPTWNPNGTRAELEILVRNTRAMLAVLVAGERGNVARAAFERRKADPQDPEKRSSFDTLSARERGDLAQLAVDVQSEAERRGLIAAAGAGVRGARRGN